MKKIWQSLAVSVLTLFVLSLASCGKNEEKIDFSSVQKECCDGNTIWSEVGSDNSFLKIDTNPYDEEETIWKLLYMKPAMEAIQKTNEALGFDESLYAQMNRAIIKGESDKAQNENILVEWSYQSDKGLEVVYKSIK